jgi:hypothetical protein
MTISTVGRLLPEFETMACLGGNVWSRTDLGAPISQGSFQL